MLPFHLGYYFPALIDGEIKVTAPTAVGVDLIDRSRHGEGVNALSDALKTWPVES